MSLLSQTRWTNWTLSIVLVGGIASGMFFLSRTVDQVARARIVHTVTMSPSADQLKAGEQFKITADITVYEVCPYELRWTLVNDEDEAVLYMIEPAVKYPGLGRQTVVSPHFIPAHVKPGKYVYEVQVFDLCERVKVAAPVRIDVVVH